MHLRGRGKGEKRGKDRDMCVRKDAVRSVHGKAHRGEREKGSNSEKPA